MPITAYNIVLQSSFVTSVLYWTDIPDLLKKFCSNCNTQRRLKGFGRPGLAWGVSRMAPIKSGPLVYRGSQLCNAR